MLVLAMYDFVFALDLQNVFTFIHDSGKWTDAEKETVSGGGSKIRSTVIIRKELPKVVEVFKIQSLLDIPCGDFNWMKTLKLPVHYIGADIVPYLVQANQKQYGSSLQEFRHLDATCDPLPQVDLILCRDCLAHLSFKNVAAVIRNFKNSGSKYLIVSNFTAAQSNYDIEDGDFHPLNLQKPPFDFPSPLISINEHAPEGVDKLYKKHLSLWRLSNISMDTIEAT